MLENKKIVRYGLKIFFDATFLISIWYFAKELISTNQLYTYEYSSFLISWACIWFSLKLAIQRECSIRGIVTEYGVQKKYPNFHEVKLGVVLWMIFLLFISPSIFSDFEATYYMEQAKTLRCILVLPLSVLLCIFSYKLSRVQEKCIESFKDGLKEDFNLIQGINSANATYNCIIRWRKHEKYC